MPKQQGVKVKVQPGETEKQATDRFLKEAQKRLDGKGSTRMKDPEDEKAVQDFVKQSVKQAQAEIKKMFR